MLQGFQRTHWITKHTRQVPVTKTRMVPPSSRALFEYDTSPYPRSGQRPGYTYENYTAYVTEHYTGA